MDSTPNEQLATFPLASDRSQGGVGPGLVLNQERAQATFPVDAMTEILNGGAEHLAKRRAIRAIIEADPVFRKWQRPFMSRTERYVHALQKTKRFVELANEHSWLEKEEMSIAYQCIDEDLPIALHTSMFIPTLQAQATEEQKTKWLEPARKFQIFGTYAQTEIGHGSFVRGIETTATFDESTKEFVINTPTLTARKCWPGGMGKTSTHAVVMARLVVKGKDLGVHPFVVQLRSLETHESMPGITQSDIGPKFGYITVDNGCLHFDQVRVPFDSMLSRFAKLDPVTGQYTRPVHDKISYNTMVYVRSTLVSGSANYLARACTISLRYSAVRRQFPVPGSEGKLNAPEQSVLNYLTQQQQLLPLLATSYACFFAGKWMMDKYHENLRLLEKNDVSMLAELHASTSGLKALATELSCEGIETCRRCMGGHGFSAATGIIEIYANWLPSRTYEGEHTVLLLQVARYLVKCANILASKQGQGKLPQNMAYLSQHAPSLFPKPAKGVHAPVQNAGDWLKPEVQKLVLGRRAARLALEASAMVRARRQQILNDRKNQGVASKTISFEHASEFATVELCRAARAHSVFMLASLFIDGVASVVSPSGSVADPKLSAVQRVLKTLGDLFVLSTIEKELGDFTEDGFVTAQQARWLRAQSRALLAPVRRDSIALVDAWDFTDHFLNSPLGRYDGNVYEAYVQWFSKEPLNRTNVAPGIRENLQPLIKSRL